MIKQACILMAVVVLVFSPCLKAGFINLDDDGHIVNNPAIGQLTPGSVNQIFLQTINQTYIPLTVLTFAVEKHFFGLNPSVFHLDNLLLYLVVVLLVLGLAYRLGVSPQACFWSALIFAIHPMRVESVAWATERKDLLYAFFYLLALHQYLLYVKLASRSNYYWALIFGFLSMLSKPMAFSLPLVMLLMDWWMGRKISLAVLLEKLPMALIIALFGIVTLWPNSHNLYAGLSWEGILIWVWSLIFYLRKFFFPFDISLYYSLPHPISLLNWPYAVSLLGLVTILFFLFRYHQHRLLIFAFVLYLCSIIVLLQFNERLYDIVANRFMFLPSFGFCLLAGTWIDRRLHSKLGKIILILLIVLLALKTNAQCSFWHDSMTYWNEAILEHPDYFRAYNNRGMLEQNQRSLDDFNKAIALNAQAYQAYNNRGIFYYQAYDDKRAMADFNRCLQLKPNYSEGYYNRSKLEYADGDNRGALRDAMTVDVLGGHVPEDYLTRLKSLCLHNKC